MPVTRATMSLMAECLPRTEFGMYSCDQGYSPVSEIARHSANAATEQRTSTSAAPVPKCPITAGTSSRQAATILRMPKKVTNVRL